MFHRFSSPPFSSSSSSFPCSSFLLFLSSVSSVFFTSVCTLRQSWAHCFAQFLFSHLDRGRRRRRRRRKWTLYIKTTKRMHMNLFSLLMSPTCGTKDSYTLNVGKFNNSWLCPNGRRIFIPWIPASTCWLRVWANLQARKRRLAENNFQSCPSPNIALNI